MDRFLWDSPGYSIFTSISFTKTNILDTLSKRDQKFIWHPLTQHKTHPEMLAISRAEGVYLYDEEGKAYIDGISSWYTTVYGHCNPYITSRVYAQISFSTRSFSVGLPMSLLRPFPRNLYPCFPKISSACFFRTWFDGCRSRRKNGLAIPFQTGKPKNPPGL